MLAKDNLEAVEKLLGIVNELLKLGALVLVAALAISMAADPSGVRNWLALRGLAVSDINLGVVKIVAKETEKAGNDTLRISEALTKVELKLSEMKVADIADALGVVRSARAALEDQSSSLKATGRAVGVEPAPPALGWLHVGLFGENGEVKRLGDRIRPKDGLTYAGNKLESLVIRFDTPVVSDGDDCTKTDVSNFVPPAAGTPERQYAVLRVSDEPLKVVATKACASIGGLKVVYAQVAVPAARVRFATLSSLKR